MYINKFDKIYRQIINENNGLSYSSCSIKSDENGNLIIPNTFLLKIGWGNECYISIGGTSLDDVMLGRTREQTDPQDGSRIFQIKKDKFGNFKFNLSKYVYDFQPNEFYTLKYEKNDGYPYICIQFGEDQTQDQYELFTEDQPPFINIYAEANGIVTIPTDFINKLHWNKYKKLYIAKQNNNILAISPICNYIFKDLIELETLDVIKKNQNNVYQIDLKESLPETNINRKLKLEYDDQYGFCFLFNE